MKKLIKENQNRQVFNSNKIEQKSAAFLFEITLSFCSENRVLNLY